MKAGDLVYVPSLKIYGFIQDIKKDGRIHSIRSLNLSTGHFDIIQVYDLIVEAVGLIKRLIVIFKMMFPKKVKA